VAVAGCVCAHGAARQALIGRAELQMRRPGKDKYRLDNLLQRKAREGVKIFIIL
jgi:phosphatidylserine/phosphatidylglycerophosphate/cardiolipin synthase-like enzyme